MATEDKEGGVVLLGEELEAGGIFEGVDGVLFGETDAEGAFEGVEVCEEVVDEGGSAGAAQEEGSLGVFVDVGLSSGKLSL